MPDRQVFSKMSIEDNFFWGIYNKIREQKTKLKDVYEIFPILEKGKTKG